MTETRQGRGRLQFLMIAAIFLGPLLVAAWMYFASPGLAPQGRTNHGALLQPITRLAEVLPDAALHSQTDGRWALLYANAGVCDENCEFSLYTLRQARLMLGRDRDRLARVFLHGDSPPDKVFLAEEHAGLVTMHDGALADLLRSKRPVDLDAGGYYLIDPLGNLVMYFPPDIDPADMVEDIEHLLELSRIG